MVYLEQTIRFILNDRVIQARVPPGMLVLDYLRTQQQLTGTKEGCKEGDCGACTVILGERTAAGPIRYSPMTSCLLPMGELEGKHLVTVEGLALGEHLSPVQAAMVDCGGTQCGYCTPGFVVAMTAGLMEPRVPLDESGMLYAISGNLCRCTGYRSIKEAGMQAIEALKDQLADGPRIEALCEAGALPAYFKTIPDRLAELVAVETDTDDAAEDALVLAGGTDLYVQRGEQIPELPVRLLNLDSGPRPAELRDGSLYLDARMSFEDFAADPLVRKKYPSSFRL